MRPATVLLLCALPPGAGCAWEGNSGPCAGLPSGNRELARFETAVQQAARERAHTAVAFAAGPERLVWGVAVSEPMPAAAKALAMSRCLSRVKQDKVPAPCTIYAINGQPRFLDEN